jgi:hypothetical protein
MTWLELLNQVSFRLNRPDLPADFVRHMAEERVTFYGPQIFQPAEGTNDSITTQPGQYFYQLPSGTQRINFVRILYGGIFIPVTLVDNYNDILMVDVLQPPFTSVPVSLAKVYGNQLRLFPTPDGQYTIELTGMFTIGAPTDDNDDTNFWVTDGRVLEINATMLEICNEYLDLTDPSPIRTQRLKQNTDEALNQLMSQAHAYGGSLIQRQRI